jgi:hypothetical protein
MRTLSDFCIVPGNRAGDHYVIVHGQPRLNVATGRSVLVPAVAEPALDYDAPRAPLLPVLGLPGKLIPRHLYYRVHNK